jgi:hypothetical protein
MAVEVPGNVAKLLKDPKICWQEELYGGDILGWEVSGHGMPEQGSPLRTGADVSEEAAGPTWLGQAEGETFIYSTKLTAGTKWRVRFKRIPCPETTGAGEYGPGGEGPSVTVSLGGASSRTSFTNVQDISFFTIDPSTDAHIIVPNPGFVGGLGGYVPFEQFQEVFEQMLSGATGSASPTAMRYAPEDKPASGFPAVLPTKAPPAAPPPRITFGIDGNVYFFAGPNATINGIPGGPGITPTGNDSFNFRDKVLFTAGGVINVPINATWTVALTGGFAEADKSATYNCGTYCTTGGVTPFSTSKDVWLPGGYVGGRLIVPLTLAPWPGTTIAFDYKHVMLASESVTLGSPATRQVTANVSQGIDLFMVRLAVPLTR